MQNQVQSLTNGLKLAEERNQQVAGLEIQHNQAQQEVFNLRRERTTAEHRARELKEELNQVSVEKGRLRDENSAYLAEGRSIEGELGILRDSG
eukprot:4212294-Amphidinium_carterae.1